jgi:hypothetical protein
MAAKFCNRVAYVLCGNIIFMKFYEATLPFTIEVHPTINIKMSTTQSFEFEGSH